MAEYVTVRNQFGEERRIPKASAPFFVNQGFRVLDSKGHVSAKATAASSTTSDKKD